MSNKEIKLRMGFMDKNGKLVEIPEIVKEKTSDKQRKIRRID